MMNVRRNNDWRRTTHRLVTAVVLSAAAILVASPSASAAVTAPFQPGTGTLSVQTAPGDLLDPRTYAPDSRLFLVLHATGVQKYTCLANGTWLFTDPEATLFKTNGTAKPVGTHFLNFSSGRPVWQLKDGSSVEAARAQSAPGGAGNIASLLLQTVVTTSGLDGDRLGETTWIQRLNTSGGVAPAGTCALGATIAVPYSTDYLFWHATG